MSGVGLISVIIPTYNRCEQLKITLTSLLEQYLNPSFVYEVLVIDNNSTDRTKETVENMMGSFEGRLHYFFERQQGKSFALNRGLNEACGEILAMTDDDCLIDKNWLLSIWTHFNNYQCDAMGGRVLPLYPPKTPKWITENRALLNGPIVLHDYGDDVKPYQHPMLPFIGANMVVKKELITRDCPFERAIGPGTGIMGEDTYLFRALQKLNKTIYYCGQALVWHPVNKQRMTIRYISKWYFSYGRYVVFEKNRFEQENVVHLFGVPRYLIKRLIKNALSLMPAIMDQKRLLREWIRLMVCLGTIQQYRKLRPC